MAHIGGPPNFGRLPRNGVEAMESTKSPSGVSGLRPVENVKEQGQSDAREQLNQRCEHRQRRNHALQPKESLTALIGK